MPLTPYTIAVAKISQYLWSTQILKDNSFNNGSINNGRDIFIYMENAALQYGEEQITFVPAEGFNYLLADNDNILLIDDNNEFLI